MTTGVQNAPQSNQWRRRLRPAASVVLFGVAAALALLGVLTLVLPRGSGPHDPPVARPLPAAALADEQDSIFERAGTHAVKSRRRLVDVVDRNAPRPVRIRIPSIGVSSRVVPLGLGPNRTMQTPKNFAEAGWYQPGREPGEQGAAVMVGHVDSKTGPAAFYKLRKLRRGDLIRIVRADGSAVRFRVEGLERWPKSDFPTKKVFGRTHKSTLRLVTCSGNFDPSIGHYVDNTIAYAVRVPSRVKR